MVLICQLLCVKYFSFSVQMDMCVIRKQWLLPTSVWGSLCISIYIILSAVILSELQLNVVFFHTSLSLCAPPRPLPFVAAIMIILITVQLLCGICLSIPLTVRPSLLKHKSGISHICSILVQTADLEKTLKKGTSRPHLGVEHYLASLGD